MSRPGGCQTSRRPSPPLPPSHLSRLSSCSTTGRQRWLLLSLGSGKALRSKRVRSLCGRGMYEEAIMCVSERFTITCRCSGHGSRDAAITSREGQQGAAPPSCATDGLNAYMGTGMEALRKIEREATSRNRDTTKAAHCRRRALHSRGRPSLPCSLPLRSSEARGLVPSSPCGHR